MRNAAGNFGAINSLGSNHSSFFAGELPVNSSIGKNNIIEKTITFDFRVLTNQDSFTMHKSNRTFTPVKE